MVAASVTPPPTETRRERRKREVHERILLAATELFDAQGVAATTVAEICERADVAHKTFFNHFPTRQHLIQDIAHVALAQLLADIEAVRAEPGSTPERLGRFFARVADNAEAAGPMHRELLTELIHEAHDEQSGSEQARKIQGAFGALVRDGRVQGDVDPRTPLDTLTEMVMGAFYVLMFNWAHLEGYPLRRQALAAARFLGDAMAPAAERRSP